MRHRLLSSFPAALCSLFIVQSLVLPAQARASTRVARIPSSIDATGAKDVSAQMASFISSVPDGTVVQLAPHGRYRMDDTLVLSNRHQLTIEGDSAAFFARTPGGSHRANVRVVNSAHIVIRDLTVHGANPNAGVSLAAYQPAKEHQHGFEILSSTDVALLNVTATDTFGDFVYLGRTEHGPWTSHVLIRDSHFARNGRQGISVIAASDVVIERNSITDVRMATFDFEPNGAGAGVSQVTVRNNDVGAGRLLFVAAEGLGPVNHVSVTGNRLRGQSLQVWVGNSKPGYRNDWMIEGNTSNAVLGNPHGSAMRISRVNGLVVVGNRQGFQVGRRMVVADIVNSCRVVVRDNSRPGSVGETRVSGAC